MRLELPLSCVGTDDIERGRSGKDARYLSKFHRLLATTHEADCKLPLHLARKMAGKRSFRTEACN